MITRLFFRLRVWLILFIFLSLTISVPHSPAPEEVPSGQPSLVGEISLNEEEEPALVMECLLEIIIEEGFGLYNLFPASGWPSDDLIVASEANFDLISEKSFAVKFYPPRVKRLLAHDIPLPEQRYSEPPTGPPEMKL